MASGVAAGLKDKLATATQNQINKRPTGPSAIMKPPAAVPDTGIAGAINAFQNKPPGTPPTSNPALGNGGATYGSSGAVNDALENNAKSLSDPAYRQSEIDRTQSVIKQRQASGMDVTAQNKYLYTNLGYTDPVTQEPVTTPGVNQPPPGINNIQYNPSNIYTPGSNGGYDPAAQEKAYLQMQLDALSGQQKSAQLATQFGVDTNKAYLAEQLANLEKQNNVDNDQAQQLQNRRGGFYSGGLDTQLSSIGSGYAEAQGGVTRDVAARNQQLLDQYGNQANSIAQQIQELQSASPDIIRQRIQSWIDNERNYGLDYANTFGNLNGQQTQSQQNQNWNQQFAQDQFNYGKTQDQIQNEAQYAGQYNGNQTIQQQQQNIQNQAQYAGQYNGQNTVGQDQQLWENRYNYGNAIGQFGNGQQTQSYQQQQIANKQWQDTFDRGKYESDRTYQQQKQQEAIANGQWQQTFNQDVEKMGFDQASQLWTQAFQENQAGQDDAYRKQQLEQDMTDKDRSAATQATTAIMNSGLVTTTNDPKTGKQSMNVSNPDSLSKYILALNLSDNATDALLYQYGLDSYVKK